MHSAVNPKPVAAMLLMVYVSEPLARARSFTNPVDGFACSQKKLKAARSMSSSNWSSVPVYPLPALLLCEVEEEQDGLPAKENSGATRSRRLPRSRNCRRVVLPGAANSAESAMGYTRNTRQLSIDCAAVDNRFRKLACWIHTAVTNSIRSCRLCISRGRRGL